MPETHADSANQAAEKLFNLLVARRWWILPAASCVTLGVVGFAMLLPDRYQSEASLEIVQPVVSQRYVSDTDATSPMDVVQALKREVLSRARLMAIIDEFRLYPEARQKAGEEVLTDLMRKRVDLEPLDQIPGRSEFSAFKITFTADDPALSQAVTRRLTSLFIEEQLKTQTSEASATTQFLSAQLEVAQRGLAGQEARRRDFEMRHRGELPEQQTANLSVLGDLRTQLQSVTDRAARAEEQRRTVEGALNDKLAALQSEKAVLLTQYTARHPKVEAKEEEIRNMAALLGNLKSQRPVSPAVLPPALSDDSAVAGLIAQVEANRREAQSLAADQARLQREIAQYQDRLNFAPVRERELAEVVRESDVYSQQVKDLEGKLLQARQTTRVAQDQQGRRFRLVDPPTLPTRASGPPRLRIALGGLAAGLLLGFALALVAERRDTTFHHEKDLARHFQAPLILGIPQVLSPSERRFRAARAGFEWVAGCLLVLALAGAEFYVYRWG